MKTAIIIYVISLISASCLFSQNKALPRDNMDVQDSILREYAGDYANSLKNNGIDQIFLSIPTHEADFFVENVFSEILLERGIALSAENLLEKGSAEFLIRSFKVDYSRTVRSEYVIREVIIDISILTKHTKTFHFGEGPIIYSDTLRREDIAYVEQGAYGFAEGKLPKENEGFIKKVIEPVMVVTAAAVTVILFFTVRSQ
ncbi:MAG: hypothetical protein ACLFR2_09810 [Candidatus Kapaibacterium sp.]